jgi:hypothetical protein
MIIYRVTLNNTYSGLAFDFTNWDDATNFAGMAVDYGSYENSSGEVESVKVTIQEVDL